MCLYHKGIIGGLVQKYNPPGATFKDPLSFLLSEMVEIKLDTFRSYILMSSTLDQSGLPNESARGEQIFHLTYNL